MATNDELRAGSGRRLLVMMPIKGWSERTAGVMIASARS
jgi:hypothetical protein